MQRYFRSDTRPPEGKDGVFNIGFPNRTPRKTDSDWWTSTIDTTYLSGKTRLIDTDPKRMISLTSHMESAAVFPFGECSTSYIYVMFLPNPVKLEAKEGTLCCLSTTIPCKDRIIDLHTLQTEEAYASIVSEMRENPLYYDDRMGVFFGYPLHAYESFAYEVPRENIYCTVQIISTRPAIKKFLDCDLHGAGRFAWYDKEFSIGEISFNPNFQYQIIQMNLQFEINEVLREITKLKAKKSFQTPSPYYGLGGKIFPIPETSSSEKFSKATLLAQNDWIAKNLHKDIHFSRFLLFQTGPDSLLLKNHNENKHVGKSFGASPVKPT